jgi:hypothetical protein
VNTLAATSEPQAIAKVCRRYRCITCASVWGWRGPGPVMWLQVRLFRFRLSAPVIAMSVASWFWVTGFGLSSHKCLVLTG